MKKFRLFQIDTKSAFLNGYIEDEAYVEQPDGFIDFYFRNHVYKLSKTLYKRSPRAWYKSLIKVLIKKGFKRDNINKIS